MGAAFSSTAQADALTLPALTAWRLVAGIDGVGDHDARRVRETGIVPIGQRSEADRRTVADPRDVPEPITDPGRARRGLIDVRGIGPEFAARLIRCNVRSVLGLAQSDPRERVAGILLTTREPMVRIQRAPLGSRQAENWIEAARAYVNGQ